MINNNIIYYLLLKLLILFDGNIKTSFSNSISKGSR